MEKIGDTLGKLDPTKVSKTVSDSLSPELTEEVCPICGGSGIVHPLKEDGKVDYTDVVPCICVKDKIEQEKMAKMLKHCDLPADSGKLTFENFKVDDFNRQAHDAALELAEERGIKWLTLLGTVDQGKTHLAIAICRRWLARCKPARYTYVSRLLHELREGYGKEGDMSFDAKLRFFMNVPLLVLDDLGVEKPTEFTREKLNMIIDHRYNEGLALVVTTNMPLKDLPGDEQHRIASRLERFKPGRVVAMEGPEYRLRGKQGGKK